MCTPGAGSSTSSSIVASRSSSSSWGSAETSAIGPRSSLTTRPYRYAPAVNEPTLSQRVRLHIFEQLVETGSPSVVEELMVEFGLSRAETTGVLRELADARHIALVEGTARILMAFPFSAIATPFRVTANGRDYFANCAWDAVAFHSMLDVPIAIDSFCHHCAPANSHRDERRPRHARSSRSRRSSTLRSSRRNGGRTSSRPAPTRWSFLPHPNIETHPI